MKVGDLVKINLKSRDDWGVGVIVKFDNTYLSDVLVAWSKLQEMCWEMSTVLEVIYESR